MLDSKTLIKDISKNILKGKYMIGFWVCLSVGLSTLGYFYGEPIRIKYVKGHESEASMIIWTSFVAITFILNIFANEIWPINYHENSEEGTLENKLQNLELDKNIQIEKERAYIEHIYKLEKLALKYEDDHLYKLSRAAREEIELEKIRHGSDLNYVFRPKTKVA